MLSELWFIYKDLYIWIGPGRNVQKMRLKASWGENRRACFSFLSIFSIAARGQILVLSLAHVRFCHLWNGDVTTCLLPRSVHGPSVHSFRLLHPPGVSTYRQAGELELISHWGWGWTSRFTWFDSKGSALTYLSIQSASPLLSWRFLSVLWELR